MPDRVLYDFEFCVIGAPALFLTAEEGRDVIAIDAERIRLQVHPDALTLEETIVSRDPRTLAYFRVTRRTIPEESTIEDGGQVKVAGGRDAG